MKTKRKIKFMSIIAALVILSLTISVSHVLAANVNSLKKEQKNVKEEISETKTQLDGIKEELTGTMAEIRNLLDDISKYETEIDDLDDKVEELNKSINSAEKKIAEAEAELEEKQTLLNKRLVALYKAGDSKYLDVLLSSESITDFISNYYLIEELTEHDTSLIDQVQAAKEKVEKTKADLEANKVEIQEAKKKKELKLQSLAVLKRQKESKASTLTSNQKKLKDQLEELNAENRNLDRKIRQAQAAIKNAKQDYYIGGGKSSVGFIRPVNGYPVTTGIYYSSGRYHGAVDFSGSGIFGQPVYAVADGYVVTTRALNYSYGNYILIAHYNGLYTLYAHGKSGSIRVHEGQTVKQGQAIMSVGSTGNSTGPHLHFEVRTGSGSYSERANPLNYLP